MSSMDKDSEINNLKIFSDLYILIISLLFWSIAWWLFVFWNLRKLWEKEFAIFPLILSILITFTISYLINWEVPGYYHLIVLIILLLNPLIFLTIQNISLKAQKQNTLNISNYSIWKAILVWLFWLILFVIFLFLWLIICTINFWAPTT